MDVSLHLVDGARLAARFTGPEPDHPNSGWLSIDSYDASGRHQEIVFFFHSIVYEPKFASIAKAINDAFAETAPGIVHIVEYENDPPDRAAGGAYDPDLVTRNDAAILANLRAAVAGPDDDDVDI